MKYSTRWGAALVKTRKQEVMVAVIFAVLVTFIAAILAGNGARASAIYVGLVGIVGVILFVVLKNRNLRKPRW